MLTTGIDIVEIARVARMLVHGTRLLGRVYTAAEWHYGDNNPARLAGMFAAKEAAAKALGCGLDYMTTGGVALCDLEITGDAGGRPCLTLHGTAHTQAEARGWRTWSVSLSTTQQHAVALVVAVSYFGMR